MFSILCELTKFGVPVIATGDFNMVMDRNLDRFHPGTRKGNLVDNRLSNFLKEIGLEDIW